MAFRRRRRSGRRGSSGRKTRWIGANWQGTVAMDAALNATVPHFEWASFWLKWPADRPREFIEGSNAQSLEPSDETVVREIIRLNCSVEPQATPQVLESPVQVTFGVIAFDGGNSPVFYENAIFDNTNSLVAPPHPNVDVDDDWLWRQPTTFIYTNNQSPGAEDIFVQSRAKRKLPPGTGLLIVMAPLALIDVVSTPVEVRWGLDWRAAIRTGYTR